MEPTSGEKRGCIIVDTHRGPMEEERDSGLSPR